MNIQPDDSGRVIACGAPPAGCRCGKACEFPCWQRVGIAPACGLCGCEPFREGPWREPFDEEPWRP